MRAKRLSAQGLLSVRRCTECHRACTCDVQIFNIILDSLWIAALISVVVLLLASSHRGLFYNLAIFSYRVDICFQPTSPLTLGKAVFLCQCFHSPTRLLSPLDGVGCPWVGCPCPCQTKQHNLMVLAIYFAVIQAERSPRPRTQMQDLTSILKTVEIQQIAVLFCSGKKWVLCLQHLEIIISVNYILTFSSNESLNKK